MVDAGRRLVVFGGSNGTDCFNDVYALDCSSGVSAAAAEERWTWSQPAIRGRGELSAVRGCAWRIGWPLFVRARVWSARWYSGRNDTARARISRAAIDTPS